MTCVEYVSINALVFMCMHLNIFQFIVVHKENSPIFVPYMKIKLQGTNIIAINFILELIWQLFCLNCVKCPNPDFAHVKFIEL